MRGGLKAILHSKKIRVDGACGLDLTLFVEWVFLNKNHFVRDKDAHFPPKVCAKRLRGLCLLWLITRISVKHKIFYMYKYIVLITLFIIGIFILLNAHGFAAFILSLILILPLLFIKLINKFIRYFNEDEDNEEDI